MVDDWMMPRRCWVLGDCDISSSETCWSENASSLVSPRGIISRVRHSKTHAHGGWFFFFLENVSIHSISEYIYRWTYEAIHCHYSASNDKWGIWDYLGEGVVGQKQSWGEGTEVNIYVFLFVIGHLSPLAISEISSDPTLIRKFSSVLINKFSNYHFHLSMSTVDTYAELQKW